MNLLVTGAWQGFENCRQEILSMGHDVAFLQWEKESLPVDYDWVEGVIGNGFFLTHPIEKFENLRYIQLTSAGYDRVPMDYVEEHHIEIYNARGVYSIPIAEYAVGGVLQLYKHFREFAESQKKHEWNKIREIRELYGSTVCILGCGSVGSECAKRFAAFGCRVLGVDVCQMSREYYVSIVSIEELNTVLGQADILVITLPLTDMTRGLVGQDALKALKEGALVVNIARGGLMDYGALTTGLKDGYIGGAVLDVFEAEPLDPESPLWDMKQVIITPHNSFAGDGNQYRLNRVIIDHLKALS